MIATMNLLVHLDLLTMPTTAKIVTHNKMQHRVMATVMGQKIQHRVKKKKRLKMISEQTNPLLEQIREGVSGALSANGMAVP